MKYAPLVLFSRIDHKNYRYPGCECQRCTPTMNPATARFLVSQNGGLVTKLKIRAGERVQHWERRDNGEGITIVIREWEFDGTTVYLAWASDGTDCDGRLQRSGSAWCDYSRLGDGYTDSEGQRWPRWEHVDGPQRDHRAEAAGY